MSVEVGSVKADELRREDGTEIEGPVLIYDFQTGQAKIEGRGVFEQAATEEVDEAIRMGFGKKLPILLPVLG